MSCGIDSERSEVTLTAQDCCSHVISVLSVSMILLCDDYSTSEASAYISTLFHTN